VSRSNHTHTGYKNTLNVSVTRHHGLKEERSNFASCGQTW